MAETWRRFRCDNITACAKGVVAAVRRDFPQVEISAATRTSAKLATREAGFGGFCIFEWTPRQEKLLPLFAAE